MNMLRVLSKLFAFCRFFLGEYMCKVGKFCKQKIILIYSPQRQINLRLAGMVPYQNLIRQHRPPSTDTKLENRNLDKMLRFTLKSAEM